MKRYITMTGETRGTIEYRGTAKNEKSQIVIEDVGDGKYIVRAHKIVSRDLTDPLSWAEAYGIFKAVTK